MQKYQSIITATNGSVIRNVPVTVIKEDGSLAEIFMDREGQAQAPNPLVTDSRGVFYFYAKNGRYSLRTAADGVQITDADTVLLFDPDETASDGPIADAVRRAEDAAERAETALGDSGLQNMVQDAQDAAANAAQAVIDAHQAVASIDAALMEVSEAKEDAQAAAQTASTAASDAQAVKDSLLNYDGTLSAAPSFDDVPAHTDPAFDAQAQALANRTEIIKSAVLSFPDYAAASAAAATLPDGQGLEVEADETRNGRRTICKVQGGSLVFDRMASDVASVTEFGAKGDGVTDDTSAIQAASAAVAGMGGGTVSFPVGSWNYTFSKPPYGVVWEFNGPEMNRAQLGGTNSNVRYMRPRLAYMPGPHQTSQLHVEHIRAIAKGSNAIGAPFADYGLGITVEKEFWSETSGTPTAGEINGLAIFTRNGALTGDPTKTGGAGILFDLGQTAGTGYTQVIEAINSVFTKGTLAVEKQTNMQLLGIDERDGVSYGAIFNSISGTQSSAIRVFGTSTSRWRRIIECVIGSVNNYNVEDTGRHRWRTAAGTNISLDFDEASGELVFRNNSSADILRVGQTRITATPNTPRTNTTTSDTVSESDHDRIVQQANSAAIAVSLSATARAGTKVKVIQRDQGQVTFTPATGATLRNRLGHTKTAGQYAVVTLEVAANGSGTAAVWYLSGDTSA